MTIASISDNCIKRLCAGQVITTLATCIKELVENSLDAGSKNIEIVFRNNGTESLSVTDDGAGILAEDFPFLGQNHFTSKLKDFTDLSTIHSYGFRGEALFSIATVSELCTILSKNTQDADRLGMKLELRNGVAHLSDVSRKPGTTIIVDNLFSKYPVRCKEFHRGIKTQFSEAIEILTGYALANPQVRFVCYNIPKASNSRLLIFQSNGKDDLLDTCRDLFTSVKVKSFLRFEFESSVGPYRRCHGFLSKEMPASKGSFIFFNQRPCEFKKITKLINDSYRKQFDPKGNLFLILHVIYDTDAIDLNVTPDKRTIFIQKEKEFLEFLLDNISQHFHKLSGINPASSLLPSPISQKIATFTTGMPSFNVSSHSENKEETLNGKNYSEYAQKSQSPNTSYSSFGSPSPKVKITDFTKLIESEFLSNSPLSRTDFQNSINTNAEVLHNSKEQLNSNCECAKDDCNDTMKNASANINSESKYISGAIPTVFAEEPSYLCKSDLANMKIIGQFNLGFILAFLQRNGKNELYIIDQHAADEKFNFEKMFSSFSPTIQKLIHPISIELSSTEEAFIEANQEEFKNYGFHCTFNYDAPPGKRISIVATAVFDGIHFDSSGNKK